MYVIGSAGHVDHGKTSLVRAITGIDTDRLQEEKQRGLTIDLGFAWLKLPNGEEISIVDVPGHERFVNNMLAGVGGIHMALLVVSADESVMPQTVEHVAILNLLNIKRSLIVITKKDLVEDDWIDLVTNDINDLVNETTLQGSAIIPVSSTTGEGLPELIMAIQTTLKEVPEPQDLGRPRMPIDRSFSISGFGTVVTGTLIGGTLQVGQEVEIVPGGQIGRIRGLQSHKMSIQSTSPGSRVAANLSHIAQDEITRGKVLTSEDWLHPTEAIDVHLKVIPESIRPIRHNMYATVHTGSNEVVGRIRLLEHDRTEPGEETWAQIKLDAPIAVVRGDYFVIRSNSSTLGGGRIINAHAPRHRRNHLPTLNQLSLMMEGSWKQVLVACIRTDEPMNPNSIASKANLGLEVTMDKLRSLQLDGEIVSLGNNTYFYSKAGWKSVVSQTILFLEKYHKKFPMRRGAPKEELRSRLKIKPEVFVHVLSLLVESPTFVEDGSIIYISQHTPTIPAKFYTITEELLEILNRGKYSPPTNLDVDPDLLNMLAENGKVVKINDSIVLSASAYDEMVSQVKQAIIQKEKISVADVRDLFKTSRKYALGLLEHLDTIGVTRRINDIRVLR